MRHEELVRAWKDPDSRTDLVPPVPHPAGAIELDPYGALAEEQRTFTCTFLICTWAHPCNPSDYFSCSGSGSCEEAS